MQDDFFNVYDPKTGEVIDKIYPGDKIVREQQSHEDDGTMSWKVDFIKSNSRELRLLTKELSHMQKSLLFSILPYVRYESCMITHFNGKDINLSGLSEVSGISNKSIKKITGELIAMDILYKGKNSRNNQYFINPWLIYKGTRINKTLKSMFKNYKIRSRGSVKWKDLKE